MAKKPLRKKFFPVEIPLIKETSEIHAYTLEDINNKTLKFDMTRKLKGKSLDLIFGIEVKNDKAKAIPKKLRVLPFFIRHMLRKNISYIEDSIKTESKESNIIIKPFLITRKPVSRAVRKTIRNSAKNWITDYTKTKKDSELFEEVLSGKLQKPLSQKIKKIYPLALCEIRVLEIKAPLTKKAEKTEEKKEEKQESKEEAKKETTKIIPKAKKTDNKKEK
jgi:ribosomal protein S3AE